MGNIKDIIATCLTPEDLRASRLPDETLCTFLTYLYDEEDKESIAQYWIGYDGPGSTHLDKTPRIHLSDQGVYTSQEKIRVFPQIEQIIAYASGGKPSDNHFILLQKKLTQRDIADYVCKLEQTKFFRCVVLSTVSYIRVPEEMVKKSGLPQEKLQIGDAGDTSLHTPMKHE